MSFLREIAMARKLNLRRSWINGVRQGSDTSSECRDGTFLTDGSPGRDNSGSSSSADEENEEQLSQGGAEEPSGNEDAESFVSDESPGMQDVGEKAPLPGAKSAEVEPSPGQESLPELELPPTPRNQPARPTSRRICRSTMRTGSVKGTSSLDIRSCIMTSTALTASFSRTLDKQIGRPWTISCHGLGGHGPGWCRRCGTLEKPFSSVGTLR